MKTITFDEHTEEGRTLMNVARALKKSTKNAMITISNSRATEEVETPFERIPGMPYTYGERMAELRQIEAEHDPENCMLHEDFLKETSAW